METAISYRIAWTSSDGYGGDQTRYTTYAEAVCECQRRQDLSDGTGSSWAHRYHVVRDCGVYRDDNIVFRAQPRHSTSSTFDHRLPWDGYRR